MRESLLQSVFEIRQCYSLGFLKFKVCIKGTRWGVFNYRAVWVSPGKKCVVVERKEGLCEDEETALDTVLRRSALDLVYRHT
jgi:hypothetical protein